MLAQSMLKTLLILGICALTCHAAPEPPDTIPPPNPFQECDTELQGAQVVDLNRWKQDRYQRLLEKRGISSPAELLAHIRNILSGIEPLSPEDDDFVVTALASEKLVHTKRTIIAHIEVQKRSLTEKQSEALLALAQQEEGTLVGWSAEKVLKNPPTQFDAAAQAKQEKLIFPSLGFRGDAEASSRYQQLVAFENELIVNLLAPNLENARDLRKIALNDLDPKTRSLAHHLLEKLEHEFDIKLPAFTIVK